MIEKIIHGDNIEVLKTYPDNYFDSVVTDPPYGISFMGKRWDYDVPSVETWKEVLRVLKPGGHMLVACGTRTQHRMAVNIEDAGFEIRDIVAWVYGSGFPKSMDISKAIDKTFGAEREVLGISPLTEEAKKWQGWGTALKPAMELWTLARKPIEEPTIAKNVIKYGTGGINIDESRIETNEDDKYDIRHYTNEDCFVNDKPKKSQFQIKEKNILGRFPANFIHDGSEEVVELFPSEAGGGGESGYNFEKTNQDNVTHILTNIKSGVHFGDSGSAARFFYVAKASQEERNFGLYDFEEKYEAVDLPIEIENDIKTLLNL